jgi:putative ABC transport system permease protein
VHSGDAITLHGPQGAFDVQVIGTVIDYSWNRGSIIMGRTRYRTLFQDDLVDIFDVFVRPGADPAAVRETVLRRWGAENALVVLERHELRQLIADMIAKLYGMAYAQEGVVAIVAALGVLTALLISVLQRRQELGLLRAVGATRGQILGSVLAEALVMGVLGIAIGMAAGLALEWYCVQIILFEEAGFLFPVRVPWLAMLWIAPGAIAIAALAGLAPAVHTSRLRIPEAIAYE